LQREFRRTVRGGFSCSRVLEVDTVREAAANKTEQARDRDADDSQEDKGQEKRCTDLVPLNVTSTDCTTRFRQRRRAELSNYRIRRSSFASALHRRLH
jgi:hypothetical protein